MKMGTAPALAKVGGGQVDNMDSRLHGNDQRLDGDGAGPREGGGRRGG